MTANKHMLAHHGPELERARPRGRRPVPVRGRGRRRDPAPGPLAQDLAGNRIARVRGIVNGTTNYILTAMAREGRDYADVLAEAQARGYAEADPTADVEGLDAVNKLVILARLAFGALDRPAPSPTGRARRRGAAGPPGITGVTAEDVAALARRGPRRIRLIATARLAEDGAIEASVVPTAVPAGSPFGRCDGVLNRVEVDAVPLGRVAFEGPGAGGPADGARPCSPTSSRSRAASARPGPAPPLPPSGSSIEVRPVAGECVAAPSGACYPVGD